jgi:hypothetical protein
MGMARQGFLNYLTSIFVKVHAVGLRTETSERFNIGRIRIVAFAKCIQHLQSGFHGIQSLLHGWIFAQKDLILKTQNRGSGVGRGSKFNCRIAGPLRIPTFEVIASPQKNPCSPVAAC